jgi:hypothetical protein
MVRERFGSGPDAQSHWSTQGDQSAPGKACGRDTVENPAHPRAVTTDAFCSLASDRSVAR